MDAELIRAWAAILDALVWPFVLLTIVVILRGLISTAVTKGGAFRFGVKDVAEFAIEPAQGLRPPSGETEEDASRLVKDIPSVPQTAQEALPFDYYFLNHTSFLRRERQEEFRERTGVPLNHYDIRVIVDSYYRGALERIERVEYILHSSYPQPIQTRRNPEDKFLLKELANGEYVLMAKVHLKDRKEPVLLQRYITLWDSGPRLP
jgi:hypothetical protein